MGISNKTKIKAWSFILTSVLFSFILGSILFPIRFFEQFIWKYFWGPVVADAYGSTVVTRLNGSVEINPIPPFEGVVAEPGYTVVSTVSYALVLLFTLYGIMLFISRTELEFDTEFALSLIPFMFLGGVLRVIEDINTVFYSEIGNFMIPFPLNTLLISPLIYFTLFVLVVIFVSFSVILEKRNTINDSNRFVLYAGIALLILVSFFVLYVLINSDVTSTSALFLLTALSIPSVVSYSIYHLLSRYKPEYLLGTEELGLVLIWSHTLDGVVNVMTLDWSETFGIAVEYRPKHVFNALVRNITQSVQPQFISDLIGITWPFAIIKIAVAVFLIWSFDREFREENPYLFISLVLAAIAVGLGPGTRDLVRATLGI